jgi:predicted short-subunit dehydrogenase-like oxidoreductase (DUF2520 family)
VTVQVAIVGAGRVGTALARLLVDAGYALVGVASLSMDSARRACTFAGAGRAASDAAELTPEADLIFLTTPDDVIAAVCERLAESGPLRAGSVVAHCSGALPSDVLARARDAGAHVGSLHPLQSFASAEEAVRLLPGCSCAVEGDDEAARVLEAAARDIGCRPFAIKPEAKLLYHASAVVASNYLVALQAVAVRLATAAGVPAQDALPALLPLIGGTVSNIERVGIPDCLTGPIARGDAETVRRHCDEIARHAPELLDLYKVLGREALRLAVARGGPSPSAVRELEEMLE